MPNTDNLCMHCMHPVGDEEICPHCHLKTNDPQYPPFLPIRAVLVSSNNRYLVGNVIDRNGDGVTYMGWDMTQRVPVKIREFLPDGVAQRDVNTLALVPLAGGEQVYLDCLQTFRELWRSLMRYNGLSCLIKVTDVFEYNNTIYAIYEYSEDITLNDYLMNINGGNNGNLDWESARQLFMPLFSTLNTLHTAGILHRGISPYTLLIGPDGKIKLSGFSIWQARTERTDLKPELFPGYAAIEQYGFDSQHQQNSWTDVYSLAAVIYRALVGTEPIIATERVTNDRLMIPSHIAVNLPAYVINALRNALLILPDDRTRNIEQFRNAISASPSAAYSSEAHAMDSQNAQAGKQNAENTNPEKKKMNSTLKAFLISTGAVIGAGLLVFVIFLFTIFKDDFKFPQKDPAEDPSFSDVSESETVEMVIVPDLKGQHYKEITSNPVYRENFKFSYKEEYSDTVKEDCVISQSIAPENSVEKGSEITLVLSKGKEEIELPNVIGMTYEEAKAALEEKSFICVAIGEKEGYVVSVSKKPGEKLPKGSIVEITLSPKEEKPSEADSTVLDTTTSQGGGLLDNILGR